MTPQAKLTIYDQTLVQITIPSSSTPDHAIFAGVMNHKLEGTSTGLFGTIWADLPGPDVVVTARMEFFNPGGLHINFDIVGTTAWYQGGDDKITGDKRKVEITGSFNGWKQD